MKDAANKFFNLILTPPELKGFLSHKLGAKLTKDGNSWCYLLGENLQEGIAGFGDTPLDAAKDFEENYLKSQTEKPSIPHKEEK
jgi:uncharacterized protein YgfB (UPF0149 family)